MPDKTDWSQGFIAVDWGTTNRRAWAVEPDCARDLLDDGLGVMKVEPGGFPFEIRQLREKFGDRPMLLGGMIGSNRGWVETTYVPAPAALDHLVDAICWPEDGVGIVPGVSYRNDNDADVMRGEEVQILGALAAGLIAPDALVCHPGTHAKWLRMQRGAIGPFRTVMTGELFALLSKHSILADQLQSEAAPNESFRRGVEHGLDPGDLTAELFSIRARCLVGVFEPDSSSYASGLLIGADIYTGLRFGGDGPVALIGRPDLTALYAEALRIAGRESTDLDGERAFLLGAQAIAERLS